MYGIEVTGLADLANIHLCINYEIYGNIGKTCLREERFLRGVAYTLASLSHFEVFAWKYYIKACEFWK